MLLADKTFRNYNSSLLRLHTVNHSPAFSVKLLAAIKSHRHSHIHPLGIVVAYAQGQIYIYTMRNTTNKCIYRYVHLFYLQITYRPTGFGHLQGGDIEGCIT
jgi:hypothetical protein